jgi:hypothetical protein
LIKIVWFNNQGIFQTTSKNDALIKSDSVIELSRLRSHNPLHILTPTTSTTTTTTTPIKNNNNINKKSDNSLDRGKSDCVRIHRCEGRHLEV